MNFRVEPKNCYECFHMIPGHGNKKLFSMEIEILGLSYSRLTKNQKLDFLYHWSIKNE